MPGYAVWVGKERIKRVYNRAIFGGFLLGQRRRNVSSRVRKLFQERERERENQRQFSQ